MKFENIPHVFYINSDDREDLKYYTESNLVNIGITNFTRISDSNLNSKDFDNWKYLIYNEDKITPNQIQEISSSVLYINAIKEWIDNTNEDNMIIMSDHVDYSYVEYFHKKWNWDYFIKNIPHDWDSILLGFEDRLNVLPCFLHPMRDSHGTGMTLLNREYAKKLVKFHFIDGKYNFFQNISNKLWKNENGLVPLHYFMNQCGKSYAIPLFPRNPKLTIDNYFSEDVIKTNKKLYTAWWRAFKNITSMEQFHLFHSNKDFYLNPKKLESKNFSIKQGNINHNFLKD